MQTSKQYHSLALWVIMLISLSLLSACGGGSGDSNLGVQTPFRFGDELPEDTAIPINNNFLHQDSSFTGITLLNTENRPQPVEWKKGVDFHISYFNYETTTTQQSALTIASLHQTDNDKYSSAKVTENGQLVGLGLIRDTGEALFVLELIPGGSDRLTFGNALLPDPLNLDNYVGDYGCATPGCKDAIVVGYLSKAKDSDNNEFYHDVKININVKNEGNKLKASVPAWFASDRLNSEKFTVLNELSKEFGIFRDDGDFYINYYGDPNPDNDFNETLDISIRGRLFTGSTDDLFIAGSYGFYYLDTARNEEFYYYGVYALEKN